VSLRADYDQIGRTYTATRQEDPRLRDAIWRALGDAKTILNVDAGASAYEPPDRDVLALEPSEVMVAQRPEGAAPVLPGSAERIPLADDSVDVSMAILSDHHWRDRVAGLREMCRVARRRVVLFNADPADVGRFWMTNEYLPRFRELIPRAYRRPGAWEAELRGLLGDDVRFEPVPIPHECRDGFYGAFWRRPEAYLDPAVRRGISVFSRLSTEEVERGLTALRADLDSGAWQERHRDLLALDELDLGYRLVIADLG
jgi:SAM-dependent methyltransferase